jgi:hypothetical protein
LRQRENKVFVSICFLPVAYYTPNSFTLLLRTYSLLPVASRLSPFTIPQSAIRISNASRLSPIFPLTLPFPPLYMQFTHARLTRSLILRVTNHKTLFTIGGGLLLIRIFAHRLRFQLEEPSWFQSINTYQITIREVSLYYR